MLQYDRDIEYVSGITIFMFWHPQNHNFNSYMARCIYPTTFIHDMYLQIFGSVKIFRK